MDLLLIADPARLAAGSERKLLAQGAGHPVGVRMLELVSFREKVTKRETRIVGMLSYIKDNMWRAMFGKAADALERSTENEDECAGCTPHQKLQRLCPSAAPALPNAGNTRMPQRCSRGCVVPAQT